MQKLALKTQSSVTFKWEYADWASAPPAVTPRQIAEHKVVLKSNKGDGEKTVRVELGLDSNGCTAPPNCQLESVETVVVEAPKKKGKEEKKEGKEEKKKEEGKEKEEKGKEEASTPDGEGDEAMKQDAPPQTKTVTCCPNPDTPAAVDGHMRSTKRTGQSRDRACCLSQHKCDRRAQTTPGEAREARGRRKG